MFDIKKQKLDSTCEKCGRKMAITINQAMRGDTKRCHCGFSVKLNTDSSSKNDIRKIDKSFKDFERSLKKLGRLG